MVQPRTGESTMNKVKTEHPGKYNLAAQITESGDKIIAEALAILASRMKVKDHFFTTSGDVKKFLRLKLQPLEHEVFSVLFLDNQHGLIEYQEMFRGTIDAASVYPREVLKEALALNAAAVIFAHNHPSGISEPSKADQQITEKLKKALDLVDIRVLDHIIVGDTEYSFAEHGLI